MVKYRVDLSEPAENDLRDIVRYILFAIKMLRENKILPEDYAAQITGMAGYRNRLFHDYNKVIPQNLYQIIQTRLSDLEFFAATRLIRSNLKKTVKPIGLYGDPLPEIITSPAGVILTT